MIGPLAKCPRRRATRCVLRWQADLPRHPSQLEELSMNLKLMVAVAVSVLAASPALAQGQRPAAPSGAKATKADVEKVVQIITADKAKVTAYCDLTKLDDQIAEAEEKKQTKKVEELGKKASGLAQKLGPEYKKMMAGLEGVDAESADGKELFAALEPLEKQCPK
jgi:hypothetical protein